MAHTTPFASDGHHITQRTVSTARHQLRRTTPNVQATTTVNGVHYLLVCLYRVYRCLGSLQVPAMSTRRELSACNVLRW